MFMAQQPIKCHLPTTFQALLNTSSNRRQFLLYRTVWCWTMLFLVRPAHIAYLFIAFLIDRASIFDNVLWMIKKIKKIKNMKYKHLLLSDTGVVISINKSCSVQFCLSEIELNEQALQCIYNVYSCGCRNTIWTRNFKVEANEVLPELTVNW